MEAETETEVITATDNCDEVVIFNFFDEAVEDEINSSDNESSVNNLRKISNNEIADFNSNCKIDIKDCVLQDVSSIVSYSHSSQSLKTEAEAVDTGKSKSTVNSIKTEPNIPDFSKDLHVNLEKYNFEKTHPVLFKQLQERAVEFNCNLCTYKTNRDYLLNRHLRIHESPFSTKKTCDKCGYQTKLKHTWKLHQLQHKKPGLVCKFCKKEFLYKVNLDKHIIANHFSEEVKGFLTNKLYECKYCDTYRTISKGSLVEHLSGVHNRGEKQNFKCEFCNFQSARKSGLRKHMTKHTGQRKFCCGACDKKYTDRMALDSHIIHNHRKDKILMQSIKTKIRHCKECSFFCVQKAQFETHVKNNHEAKMYVCVFCKEKFTKKTNYDQHLLLNHDNEDIKKIVTSKMYICDQCDFKSIHKNNLKSHITAIHLKKDATVEEFECDICGFRSYSQAYLNGHKRRKHTDMRKFECKTCKKKYSVKKALEYHYLSAHKDDPEFIKKITSKIVSCNVCGYKAVDISLLNKHNRTQSHIEREKSANDVQSTKS